MSTRNPLIASPPFAVENALKKIGASLRTARVRRGLTRQQMADKIGTGLRAVMDAEGGKPSTGIAVYAALLWALGLLSDFENLADPTRDAEGQALARSREKIRGRAGGGLDNDF